MISLQRLRHFIVSLLSLLDLLSLVLLLLLILLQQLICVLNLALDQPDTVGKSGLDFLLLLVNQDSSDLLENFGV